MKNADMPAMPVVTIQRVGNVEKSTSEATGLTKREMMAMHAPEMPGWFDSQWREEYEGNEMYFREEENEWGSSYLQITKRGVMAMYFAWRATYADELLAEINRTSK